MVADAKVLDEETGLKKYRYVRKGEDNFGLAFHYACLATVKSGRASFREWAKLGKYWNGR